MNILYTVPYRIGNKSYVRADSSRSTDEIRIESISWNLLTLYLYQNYTFSIGVSNYWKYKILKSDHCQFGGWIFFLFAQSKYSVWVHFSNNGLFLSVKIWFVGSSAWKSGWRFSRGTKFYGRGGVCQEPWSIWELSSEVFDWSLRRFCKMAIALSTFGKYCFIIHIL